ncbi:MAG: class I SAM-dependent methyltransferase [Thermoanaerobaculia bacterium]|nr:class I SAM-dependent methyltransferase [Thermoanaerobaculia bacterium]
MSSDCAGSLKLFSHRDTWREKPVLRRIYLEFQRLLLDQVSGDVLEIGSGTGHLSRAVGAEHSLTSLDIVLSRDLDACADAHSLPFRDQSFDGIVMLDVLHHLQRPIRFLREAVRVLRPRSRLVLIEPGITPVSWWFYYFLHAEPVDLSVDPLADGPLDPGWGAFDANQAIPTLLFCRREGRRRLSAVIPELHIVSMRRLSLWAYPLSGGFQRWQLIPTCLVGPVLGLERVVLPILGPLAAFRLCVVLERAD